MSSSFLDYYLCPEEFARFGEAKEIGEAPGFFRFGNKITCFGRSALPPGNSQNGRLPNVSPSLRIQGNEIVLPFGLDEVIDNLRRERYVATEEGGSLPGKLIRKAYSVARPFLSV